MGFIQEFKTFISRGNVIDMAVGVVIGAAFGKIVNALVAQVILGLPWQVTVGLPMAAVGTRITGAVTSTHWVLTLLQPFRGQDSSD